MQDKDNLFEEFQGTSKEDWLNKITRDLKGKSLEELNWQLGEHLKLSPFHHADDLTEELIIPQTGKTNNDWHIGEDFQVLDPVTTNKQLLAALNNGVNAPCLIFDEVPEQGTLEALFKNIEPAYIYTSFRLKQPDRFGLLAQNFADYLKSRNIPTSELEGSFLCNSDNDAVLQNMNKICGELFPMYKYIVLDFVSLASSPDAVIDHLVQFLTQTDQRFQQINADQVPQIQISLSIGKSYFIEIAKIRAIQILWSNLLSAYQVEPTPLFIDAYIDPKAYDNESNTNKIRSMTIALSAVIGGVNRLTVRPADNNNPDSFSVRIARNVQHLLKMESYLDRVIDPAAGSYYLEQLTRQFAQKAWDRFIASPN